jgi:hypothetical protein
MTTNSDAAAAVAKDARPSAELDSTGEVYAAVASELEGGGVRADVATILRETIFSDDALDSITLALERLAKLPEVGG